MIILEGGDLAGKTTLAEVLVKRYRVPIRHLGRPPAGTRHWDIVTDALYNDPTHMVYDRMCIGSHVYGQIMKDEYNKDSVTLNELHRWLYALNEANGVLIWCRASKADIEARYAQDGDWYVSLEQILQAHYLYEEIFKTIGRLKPVTLRVMQYDSSRMRPQHFVQEYDLALGRALHAETPSRRILDKCFSGEILL